MAQHIELNPVSHVTIGAVGVPGQRVFYLQGSKGSHVVTLIIEKQQAAILTNSLGALLKELAAEQKIISNANESEAMMVDTRLREPLEVLFRVGEMGLGYSEEASKIVLVAYEQVEEGVEPNIVSFWATPTQIKALIPQAESAVKAGRPICGNCGEPINREGHFCPRRNGHLH